MGIPVLRIALRLSAVPAPIQADELQLPQPDPFAGAHAPHCRPPRLSQGRQLPIHAVPCAACGQDKIPNLNLLRLLQQILQAANVVPVSMAHDGAVNGRNPLAFQKRLQHIFPHARIAAAPSVHQHGKAACPEDKAIPLPHIQAVYREPRLRPGKQHEKGQGVSREQPRQADRAAAPPIFLSPSPPPKPHHPQDPQPCRQPVSPDLPHGRPSHHQAVSRQPLYQPAQPVIVRQNIVAAPRRHPARRRGKAPQSQDQKAGIHKHGRCRRHQQVEENSVEGQRIILPNHQRRNRKLHADADQQRALPHLLKSQGRPQPGRQPADGKHRAEGELKAALRQKIGSLPQKENGRQPQGRHGIIGSPRPGRRPQAEHHNHRPHGGARASRENPIAGHQHPAQNGGAPKSHAQPPKHQVQAPADDGQVLPADGQQMGNAVLLVHLLYLRLHRVHISQQHGLKKHGVLRLADRIQYGPAAALHLCQKRIIGIGLPRTLQNPVPKQPHRHSLGAVIFREGKLPRISRPLNGLQAAPDAHPFPRRQIFPRLLCPRSLLLFHIHPYPLKLLPPVPRLRLHIRQIKAPGVLLLVQPNNTPLCRRPCLRKNGCPLLLPVQALLHPLSPHKSQDSEGKKRRQKQKAQTPPPFHRHAKASCPCRQEQKQNHRPKPLIPQGKHLSKYESRCKYHKGPFQIYILRLNCYKMFTV